MTTATLTRDASDRLVAALCNGRTLDDAVTDLRVERAAVWATAATDTRLVVALAGRNPDAPEEAARLARADYLRLLALGLTPSRAELIIGAGHPGGWRSDPLYAAACDAVSAASAPYGYIGQVRFTPQRVREFLDALRAGATVKAAAATAGITTPAVYQRRRRDNTFAVAMDAARDEGRATSRPT
ncbi:hypothetical protein ACIPSE_45010 [Streptomyces sp. NPDC090106]|uniref:hypothetical protein n=1 Tax=Streptomyces sp. NPDC090106 TaxID=3365946 RepID=UPI00383094CD